MKMIRFLQMTVKVAELTPAIKHIPPIKARRNEGMAWSANLQESAAASAVRATPLTSWTESVN